MHYKNKKGHNSFCNLQWNHTILIVYLFTIILKFLRFMFEIQFWKKIGAGLTVLRLGWFENLFWVDICSRLQVFQYKWFKSTVAGANIWLLEWKTKLKRQLSCITLHFKIFVSLTSAISSLSPWMVLKFLVLLNDCTKKFNSGFCFRIFD